MARALIWTVIVAAIVAPLVFRDRWWLRVLSVVVMVWFAGVAWTGVVGSSRLASETAHRDGIDNQVLSGEFVTPGDVLVLGTTRAAAATTLLPRRVTTYTRKEQII